MTRPRILVVGSSNTDLVVRTRRIPAPGETVLGEDLIVTAGGKGANQAVAASRLGADVAFLGRIGADSFGQLCRQSLADAGVSPEYLIEDTGAPTGAALIAVDEQGQNSIVVAPGANSRLSAEDILNQRKAFEWADTVVLQLEIPLRTVSTAIEVAADYGRRIVLNPAPVPPSVPYELLKGVHVLVPNEHESRDIIGYGESETFDAERDARTIMSMGVGAAVITLGARGAVAVDTDGRVHHTPGIPMQVVDTTAAGDCFVGALAVALSEGKTLADSVRFANGAAALSVTKKGAQASLSNRDEADEMWAAQVLHG